MGGGGGSSHFGVKLKRNFDYQMGQNLGQISTHGPHELGILGSLNGTLSSEVYGKSSVNFAF